MQVKAETAHALHDLIQFEAYYLEVCAHCTPHPRLAIHAHMPPACLFAACWLTMPRILLQQLQQGCCIHAQARRTTPTMPTVGPPPATHTHTHTPPPHRSPPHALQEMAILKAVAANPSVPVGLPSLRLPPGQALTPEQAAIISTAVPYEQGADGQPTYSLPLPNVVHRWGGLVGCEGPCAYVPLRRRTARRCYVGTYTPSHKPQARSQACSSGMQEQVHGHYCMHARQHPLHA